jgi:hypothetical protein
MADLTPAQLDRLEDALEHLEAQGVPADLEPALAQRLKEYRRLLVLSREALPLVEPSAGVLDGVMAEARAVARGAITHESSLTATGVETVREREPRGIAPPRRRSRLWIPVLGLVGSAAIGLLWIRPRAEEAAAVREQAEQVVAVAPASPPAAAPVDPTTVEAAEPVAGAVPSPVPAGDAGPSENAERAPAAEPTGAERRPAASAPSAAPAKKSSSAGEDPLDAARDAALIGGGGGALSIGWGVIEEADTKRRSGRCGLASAGYRRALQADDPRIVARGHAGLALCAEASRADGSGAVALARRLDPSIDAFLAQERARGSRGGAESSKASRAAPAARSEAAKADLYDPMSGL